MKPSLGKLWRHRSRLAAAAWIRAARRRTKQIDPICRPSTDEHRLSGAQEALVRRFAPGRSFADMGCMWRVSGAVAFLAEDCAATEVTAFDGMEPTPEFEAEHRRRESRVRFVRGLIDVRVSTGPDGDPTVPEFVRTGVDAVGMHDVVWCSGVLYHTANPCLLLQNLMSICRETLVIGTKTIPEVPGLPQAAVFFPGLDDAARRVYEPLWRTGITAPFDPDPDRVAANWWWGLTASSLRGMVDTTPGWRTAELIQCAWDRGSDDNLYLVATRNA